MTAEKDDANLDFSLLSVESTVDTNLHTMAAKPSVQSHLGECSIVDGLVNVIYALRHWCQMLWYVLHPATHSHIALKSSKARRQLGTAG